MTAQDFITDAYCDTGSTQPGETPSTPELNRALVILNQIISSRSLERDFVWTAQHGTFALTNGVNKYTMGVGGSWVTADRPVRVTAARAFQGKFERGVKVGSIEEYTASIIDGGGVTATLPEHMGVDTGAPLLTIYVWPTPNDSASIDMHYWTPITSLASLSTVIAFPTPGIEAAIRAELAVTLAPGLGRPVPVELAGNFNRFNGRVLSLNGSVEDPQMQQKGQTQ